jgi:hypothetical protein
MIEEASPRGWQGQPGRRLAQVVESPGPVGRRAFGVLGCPIGLPARFAYERRSGRGAAHRAAEAAHGEAADDHKSVVEGSIAARERSAVMGIG